MSSTKFIARNGLAVGTSAVDVVDSSGELLINAPTASKLLTARTISLSGDVVGSVSFDGSGNAAIATTIQADSVALGTDTTGNYMLNVSAGTGVSVSHTQSEGSTATVSIGQAVGTTDNVTFNNVTVSGTLTSDDITSTNISVAGNATITGNLTVSGTTTTINSTTIAIADLNLELARNATTAAAANGAGITVTGPVTPATFTYTSADDRWNLNKNLNVAGTFNSTGAITASNFSGSHSGTSSGTNTGDNAGVTSVSGTAPVVSSGGTTPTISMAAATTSVDGYLTAADWTTFNNKQATGLSLLLAGGTMTGTLNGATGTTVSFTAGTSTAADYNYVLNASNDTGTKLVVFINGSARSADGGANATTIRSDGGALILGSTSFNTNILGSTVTIASNVVLHAGNYNSYSPTLTGTGASGTWGISVTGTAASISGFNNPATAATASTIVYRDAGGDIYGRYIFATHFNQSSSNSENPTIAAFWTNSASDNYNRKSTPAHVISQLGLLTTSNYNSYALPLNAAFSTSVAADTPYTFRKTSNGTNNSAALLIENLFGNHSWGIVAELRVDQASGDRPSLLFTSGAVNTSWSVGFVTGSDDTFRITKNHGHRAYSGGWADNASGWGTPYLTITTAGVVNATTTLQQAGNQVLHAGNYSSYALPLSGGTMSGVINMSGTQTITTAGFAGIEYYNNATWQVFIGTENNTSGARFNSRTGIHTWYNNGTQTMQLSGNNLTGVGSLRFGNGNSTPASTSFSHTLAGISSNRVVNFDGNANGAPSVWWTSGSRAYGAIDAKDPGLTFWANNGSSWQQQFEINYGNVTVNTDIRSPIFYDSNNTAYYVDPNSTSNLVGLTVANTISANISGNAGTATTLQTSRTINGTGFNGSANIDTTEWFHSDRDFPSGTLITTSINYAVTSGDPFVLEIRGNSYGGIVPLDIQYQGYIYSDTIINHGGLANGLMISGLVAINVGGNLCFWFPTQGYWNGYNVKVYTAYATRATNRVTSITGTAKPTSTKEVALTANIRQSLHSGNYNSYSPTLTGTGASGTWGINITGNSATATTLQTNGAVSFTTDDSGIHVINAEGTGSNLRLGAAWNKPGIYNGSGTTSGGAANSITIGSENSIYFTTQNVERGRFDSSGIGYASASFRAPIFYDSDDTSYFVNPNGISNMYGVTVVGSASSTATATQLFLWSSDGTTSAMGFKANGAPFTNPTGAGDGYNTYLTMDTPGRGWVFSERTTGFVNVYTSGWILNNGIWQANASMRSPIFYDSNDTAYFVNPNSNSLLSSLAINGDFRTAFVSGSGGSTFSANHYSMGKDIANGGWSHPHYSDLIIGYHTGIRIGGHYSGTRFYSNSPTTDANNDGNGDGGESLLMTVGGYVGTANHTDVYVNNNLFAGSSMRAPIYYDSNDTGYYLDPNTTSDSALRIRGGALHGPNVTWSSYLLVGGDGRQNYTNSTNTASVCSTNGNLHIDSASGFTTHINWYDGTDLIVGAGDSASGRFYVYGSSNYSYATGSMRAPIFYDSNDTAYYTDPASTSVMNRISTVRTDNWLYIDNSYGHSVVGKYDSYILQGVWAMGDAYKLTAAGAAGNLYGLAWSHPNAGGMAANLGDHGLLILQNGTFKGAWGGGSFRTPGDIRGTIYYDYDNTTYYLDPNGTSNLATTVTGYMYFRSNRNTTSDSPPLQAFSNDGGGAIMSFHRGGHYAVNFGLDSDNVMRIGGWSASANRWQLDMSGNMYAAGNITAYSSDVRLKENIVTIDNALSKLHKIRGVYYDWKDIVDDLGFNPIDRHDIGVIAQEVGEVIPQAIKPAPFDTGCDGKSESGENYITVQMEKIIPLLIEAIKEQQIQIEELKTEMKAMKNKSSL